MKAEISTTPIVQDPLEDALFTMAIGLVSIPLIAIGTPVVAAIALFVSIVLEILLGIGGMVSLLILLVGAGSVLGAIYFVFWLMESLGLLEENPVDFFIHNILSGWLESLALLDIFRAPLIWMEYQIAVSKGETEFILDDRTKSLFLFLTYPFTWMACTIILPYISVFAPVVMIVYFADPTLFSREVNIFITGDDYVRETGSNFVAKAGNFNVERPMKKIFVA